MIDILKLYVSDMDHLLMSILFISGRYALRYGKTLGATLEKQMKQLGSNPVSYLLI